MATRTIKQVSEEHQQSSPHASNVIAKDIYVDDLMTGADDIQLRYNSRKRLELRKNLTTINTISIPRFLGTTNDSKVEIHGFCDASQSAYAAVVFLKIMNEDKVLVQLASAKTRVAPIKQQSLPRLELFAAVLLVNLIQTVREKSNLNIQDTYAICMDRFPNSFGLA